MTTLEVLSHLSDLDAELEKRGQPAFRSQQIRDWIFKQGVIDPSAMANLPPNLRSRLQVGRLREVGCQLSRDGTRKLLLEREPGDRFETVAIPMRSGAAWTICVSSQTGCAMGCVFCASGTLPHPRNLDGVEILDQALRQWVHSRVKPSRIVFMGMGEPLANRGGVGAAIDLFCGPFGLSPRRLTISTVGLIDGINWLADRSVKVNLAISLHSAVEETRKRLVPTLKVSLDEIEASARHYRKQTGRDVTYEIVLLGGVNDDLSHARALAARAGAGITVNLIPFNSGGAGDWKIVSKQALGKFRQILEQSGVTCTVRRQRGGDIRAACGELASIKA